MRVAKGERSFEQSEESINSQIEQDLNLKYVDVDPSDGVEDMEGLEETPKAAPAPAKKRGRPPAAAAKAAPAPKKKQVIPAEETVSVETDENADDIFSDIEI